ncbi:hypothetical protein CK203_023058 [Vitis vinifera]|uniref:Uncharacterized protein n=1 Tax=Vitis vinifera TaxID=29760 RepID=A0A438J458_VITVI|nr:hypothetical protein CK203_023058 [Vitis vinifera]
MAKKVATRRELLVRWRGIEEVIGDGGDDVLPDTPKRRRLQRLKEDCDRIEFWWFLAFSIWSPFGYLENGGNDTKGYDFGFCVLCCIGLSSVELVLYRVISAENI